MSQRNFHEWNASVLTIWLRRKKDSSKHLKEKVQKKAFQWQKREKITKLCWLFKAKCVAIIQFGKAFFFFWSAEISEVAFKPVIEMLNLFFRQQLTIIILFLTCAEGYLTCVLMTLNTSHSFIAPINSFSERKVWRTHANCHYISIEF